MSKAIELALESKKTLDELRELRKTGDICAIGNFIDGLSGEMAKAVLSHIVYSKGFGEVQP